VIIILRYKWYRSLGHVAHFPKHPHETKAIDIQSADRALNIVFFTHLVWRQVFAPPQSHDIQNSRGLMEILNIVSQFADWAVQNARWFGGVL